MFSMILGSFALGRIIRSFEITEVIGAGPDRDLPGALF
jgi:hypothetical protein